MTSILITGANRGIGLELAKAAVDKGWLVHVSVRTQAQAEELSSLLPDVQTMVFDVTDREAIAQAAAGLKAPLDVVINNAGVIGPDRQSPLNMDFEGFAQTLAINTLAPLAIAQAFLPHLRQSEHGKILTVSSQMAWMGYAKSDRIAYRSSKAAVNKVMQGLATDLEAEKIAVCLIDPGWVKTDMGGAEADNDAGDVAKGILKIAEDLEISKTGAFFKWTGEERPF
ncbi:SDR family NAD(P)-dependent oxidoreductase [uncultured Roseibium sp.]|uniref:SDR family NAD(P)-dependent oxidoreductase n=1 Tax=uncultured Roseibium sp. TaxID=1936171 RepID=UPI0025914B1F|nr:SDR family NAD(P)-dependent oxidoreductase [uncultured Roseibium sp.]